MRTHSPVSTTLHDIRVDQIVRNPENPRIVFRPKELEELLESIRRYGVQVPISVYREGSKYVLIDGERRWRCCTKLNRRTIPALVQPKPDALQNLLLMFNIHALREQWDLLTIALKLPRVIELLSEEIDGQPSERQIADYTGLSRTIIRRSKLLMNLPEKYRQDILAELNKPKNQQKLTEDFFIEMERALKTVERAIPGLIKNKNQVRDALIAKYENKVIDNITSFRYMSKIARAERVEADGAEARRVLNRLFTEHNYSIDAAYSDSVSGAYSERDLLTRIRTLLERLQNLDIDHVDDEIRASLRLLVDAASRLLGRH